MPELKNRPWTHSMIRWVSVFMATIFIFGISGCSGDDDENVEETLTTPEYISLGWQLFEVTDYYNALTTFKYAFGSAAENNDAYSGAGWCAGRGADSMNVAAGYFNTAWAGDTTNYDALAGWIFVEYQLGNYQDAIDKSLSLLNSKPGWRFLHETNIDFLDVRLTMAASYYYLGQFTESLDIVITYLNNTFEADVSSRNGQRELLNELERLRGIYG